MPLELQNSNLPLILAIAFLWLLQQGVRAAWAIFESRAARGATAQIEDVLAKAWKPQEARIAERIEKLDLEFQDQDRRIIALEARYEEQEAHWSEMGKRFERLEKSLDAIQNLLMRGGRSE